MKSKTIKSLNSIIGRLSHLNFIIDGNQLQEAIREVVRVKERLQSNDISLRKIK